MKLLLLLTPLPFFLIRPFDVYHNSVLEACVPDKLLLEENALAGHWVLTVHLYVQKSRQQQNKIK